MLKVEYCPEGWAVSDWEGADFLLRVRNATDNFDTIQVSTSLPIYLLQREVVRGNLALETVEIVYNGQSYHINEYGAILDWPTGLADISCHIAQNILEHAMAKRKAERTKRGF